MGFEPFLLPFGFPMYWSFINRIERQDKEKKRKEFEKNVRCSTVIKIRQKTIDYISLDLGEIYQEVTILIYLHFLSNVNSHSNWVSFGYGSRKMRYH
jgi:hypothetical protein